MSAETQGAAFGEFVRLHYGALADDFEPASSPGYWRRKQPCGGLSGGCREPLHATVFNDAPCHHTVYFCDNGRDERGRFTSPYLTWLAARATPAGGTEP